MSTCGGLQTDPDDPTGQTVINPTVVVEVLSPSSEDYDRGEKFAHYKQIVSAREIVLVAHDEHRIEVWRLDGERWLLHLTRGINAAHIESLGCELPLEDVYRNPLES